tara:strand:+ start:1938 stop:3140 length:1203 start_codon:yes stop_codon:yes gene_type:complete
MKVLAIGGSGGMGRFAVKTAENFADIESILVADLNSDAAKQFSDTCGQKVSGIGLDVLNKEALQEILQDVDVVLNTSGPFFKLGVPILKAAIDARCNYLDICDDWEPTIEMLNLNNRAKEKGITAVIGIGASPGLTNLLGLMAINELDEVKKIYTGWNMGSAKPEKESSQEGVNAAMEHAIEQMTGSIKVFKDGEFNYIKPLDRVTIDYPGSEKASARIFGHPEAITFPVYFPGLQESLNVAHGTEGGDLILRLLLLLVERKVLPKKIAARIFGWLESKVPDPNLDTVSKLSLPEIYGLAIGIKDGKEAAVGVSIGESKSSEFLESSNIGMGAITGIPLACALKMLIEGKITKKGVLAPESGVIDPQYFFSEFFSLLMSELDNEKELIEDFINISRSWEK